jgi:hypothetical protein
MEMVASFKDRMHYRLSDVKDHVIQCTAIIDCWDHLGLMVRLVSWMPARLKLCHHCLLYVPRLWFGYGDDQDLESAILCIDCKMHAPSQKQDRVDCVGCINLEEVWKHINHKWDLGSMGAARLKDLVQEFRDERSTLVQCPEEDALGWLEVSIPWFDMESDYSMSDGDW